MVACARDGVDGAGGGAVFEEDAFEVGDGFVGVEACRSR
jgi:hypothetical protein